MTVRRDFDVLVAGELNPDLIVSGATVEPQFGQQEIRADSAKLVIGSSSAIVACGLARLGLRVAFVGMVGDDEFGRFIVHALAARGVDVTHVLVNPDVPTGLSIILSRPADRAILTVPGAIPRLEAQHIPHSLLARSRHVHVGSYFLQTRLQPGLPDLYGMAKSLGLTTSLDTNWDPDERWNSGLDRLYPYVDVLFPNEAEARLLSRETDWQSGVLALGRIIPLVAVKRGAAGGAYARANRIRTIPAAEIAVVDTTGAGDSFDAGFLFGYLNGWDDDRCLRLALACGTLSTRALGGTGAQPTLAEALAFAGL